MKTVREWLGTEKAGEIMTKKVVCLRVSSRVADAVSLFLREQISGAPVINEDGVCVGVLSATDILNFDEKHTKLPARAGRAQGRNFDTWDPATQWWCQFGKLSGEIQSQLRESVDRFMTRDVVSVTEDTPIGEVLRHMVDAHVHRVLVLDASRRLCGIVTTMDVLAAALRAGHHELAASLSGGTTHAVD